MAINQIRKYVWLLETLRKNGKMTFKEINELWVDDEISEGVEIPIRTFHKWRIAIEDLFSINIENEGKGEYRYYISTSYEIDSNPLYNWLIDTVSLENLMINSLSLHKRILLESVPSRTFLPAIITAMKEGKALKIKHKSFGQETEKIVLIEPYCVKQFKQRWYLLGKHIKINKLFIYALDRILELEKEEDIRFTVPNDFSAEEFFKNAYGIIISDDTPLETVIIKVSDSRAHYLRTLPLHSTQKEIEVCDEYSTFEFYLCPTFDFQQEILSMAESAEVMSPQWLRESIGNMIKESYKRYNKG